MSESVTQIKPDIGGQIEGVNQAQSESNLTAVKFSELQGIFPMDEQRRRLFGKKTFDRIESPIIAIFAGVGDQIFIQTRLGLWLLNPLPKPPIFTGIQCWEPLIDEIFYTHGVTSPTFNCKLESELF